MISMKKIVFSFFLFFMGALLTTVVLSANLYLENQNKLKSEISLLQNRIANDFVTTSLVMKSISESPELNSLLNERSRSNIDDLADYFQKTIASNPSYSQLRYINQKGDEVVRIDQEQSRVTRVADSNLQNKADRYYVSDTMKLNIGEYYISPLDLNVEKNKIVEPFEPTIRISTPVADNQGNKAGLVILNVLYTDMLDSLATRDDNDQTLRIYFANSDGDWFRGPNPDDAWAFMFPGGEKLRVGHRYPKLWSKILTNDSGWIYTQDGRFFFGKVKPIELIQQNENETNKFTYFSRYLQVRDFYLVIIIHLPQMDWLILDQVVRNHILYVIAGGAIFSMLGLVIYRIKRS